MKQETKVKRAVDRLGEVKAQISDLKKQEADLKSVIVESGWDSVEGKLFRATVSEQHGARLDSGKVRKLVPASLLVKLWKPYNSVRVLVSARSEVTL